MLKSILLHVFSTIIVFSSTLSAGWHFPDAHQQVAITSFTNEIFWENGKAHVSTSIEFDNGLCGYYVNELVYQYQISEMEERKGPSDKVYIIPSNHYVKTTPKVGNISTTSFTPLFRLASKDHEPLDYTVLSINWQHDFDNLPTILSVEEIHQHSYYYHLIKLSNGNMWSSRQLTDPWSVEKVNIWCPGSRIIEIGNFGHPVLINIDSIPENTSFIEESNYLTDMIPCFTIEGQVDD